ncbi:MAG TPA: hypothetical protein VND40_06075 [Nitrososphaerales archaeon]|nr:hypothetical protein [Nitrososphaerales archaeon]
MPTVKMNFGLASLALSAFVIAFFGARIFTTINPDTVVVSGGIHFHHFWYGLAMMAAAGWLGIVSVHPALNRVYATVFGLGGGLVGDEVGLLLTLGNYRSELTYVFFVGFICVAILLVLAVRYRGPLERDLAEIDRGETLVHIGVVAAGLSALFFAFDFVTPGLGVALLGVIVALAGVEERRRARPAGAPGLKSA